MTSSGMSAFVRCTCSATGRILSSAKRWNVSAASSNSSGRWLRPGAARSGASRPPPRGTRARGAPRRTGSASRGASASTPHTASRPSSLAPRSAIASAMNARASIDSSSPCSPYVEHHRGALDRAGRVREVVAEHLVLVELGDGDAAVDASTRARGGRWPARRRRPRSRPPRPPAASWSVMAAAYRRPRSDHVARRVALGQRVRRRGRRRRRRGRRGRRRRIGHRCGCGRRGDVRDGAGRRRRGPDAPPTTVDPTTIPSPTTSPSPARPACCPRSRWSAWSRRRPSARSPRTARRRA